MSSLDITGAIVVATGAFAATATRAETIRGLMENGSSLYLVPADAVADVIHAIIDRSEVRPPMFVVAAECDQRQLSELEALRDAQHLEIVFLA